MMAKTRTFFYPVWEEDSVEQFLKETYPDNMPECICVASALTSGLVMKSQVPEQMEYRLFNNSNVFDTYDKTVIKVLFTDDPGFTTKLKEWWFSEKHLAYAKTQLPWYIGNLRNDGLTEEEIRDYSFTTSYPKPLRWDGSVVEPQIIKRGDIENMKTFFYPLPEKDPLNQFLKETYPDNMPKRIRVTDALESGAITEDQVPAQIAHHLFNTTNPFKLSDRNLMGVLFTDDPDFVTKLKDWWFGEGNLTYARSQIPWHVESLRNEGFTEEEIRNCSFSTSYPKSLRWDGSIIEQG